MQFYEWRTSRDVLRRELGWSDDQMARNELQVLTDLLREYGNQPGSPGRVGIVQTLTERKWVEEGRPYYKVWPSIIPLLTRISLDFPASMIQLPKGLGSLCLRLPRTGHPLGNIRGILAAEGISDTDADRRVISLWLDVGEEAQDSGFMWGLYGRNYLPQMPVYHFAVFPLIDKPVEQVISETPKMQGSEDQNYMDGRLLDALRLLISCLMVGAGHDEQIINPDVLAKDETAMLDAYRRRDEGRLKQIEERAFRRRGPGWDVGRKYESQSGLPYVVPPHPMRFWTGRGRTIPVVKCRRGWVTEREQLTSVPTGYAREETQ